MKCQFFGVFPAMKDYLRQHLAGFSISISTDELTEKNKDKLKPDTEVLGVFVGSKVDQAVFSRLPRLKLIVTMSTGFDQIDIYLAKKKKIPVCNVPTYGENTVAEHTLALLLALSRKLFPSVKRVKEGIFNYEGLRGWDLKGRTLGVVGNGHIGAHVIRMARGFEMRVLAHDAFPNKKLADDLGFSYVSLEELLGESDVVTLHVPLLKATKHLINKENIKTMKPGAYLINTARGALVETEALAWAIESGHLAGAGLDVLEGEEDLQHPDHLLFERHSAEDIKIALMDNILIDHPNVIITPHNAFNSAEALERILAVTIENIKSFAIGKPQNDVT